MTVAIIGAGKVGGAIARGLAGKGHAVTFGVRDPASATITALAASVGADVSPARQARRRPRISSFSRCPGERRQRPWPHSGILRARP